MLQNNITTVIQKNAVASTSEIDEKLMTLQNELLKKAHNRDAYDDVADEIFQLRELKSKSESGKIQRNEKLSHITDLCDFIKSQPAGITEFDESLSRRLIKKSPSLTTTSQWSSNPVLVWKLRNEESKLAFED